MRKLICLLFTAFIILGSASETFALGSVPKDVNFSEKTGGRATQAMIKTVHNMSLEINDASSTMMKLGSMLWCYTFYSKEALVSFTIATYSVKIPSINISTLLPAIILYTLGFFIMLIASFYMFDVAFNLSVSIILLPLGLALWPFAWTKDKLGTIVTNIVYYVGLFIFLPLGIFIAKALVIKIIADTCGSEAAFIQAFDNNESDKIDKTFSIITLNFWKILLCYIVAIRLIPLMANDFCAHYFGTAMLGSPMSDRMTNLLGGVKNSVMKLAGGVKNIAKQKIKNGVASFVSPKKSNMSSFSNRVRQRYADMLRK